MPSWTVLPLLPMDKGFCLAVTKGLRIPRGYQKYLCFEKQRSLDDEEKALLPAVFGSETARHATRQLRAMRFHEGDADTRKSTPMMRSPPATPCPGSK